MSGVPGVITELVERFARHRDAYHSGRYTETQVRREFIDPFFVALGWDVANEQGFAEPYKDVIHEDAIKVGGTTEAPDYCFRIGGTRKFFVEAKKPSVDVGAAIHPAYQLRRYAWSAKLPLSVLTDFEEFAVYDCRIRPRPTDKAATARIMYLSYTEYPARWEEISSVFSRQAILTGSFDKFAAAQRRPRGTAEVDDEFLREIESWRLGLARNIALRNRRLTARQLNFAVQQTVDRIIFLRMCEDRGIEPTGQLMGLLNGDRVYARLFEVFRRADERYNSGLFHFTTEKGRTEPPDQLTPQLRIDDKVLRDIIKRLYYPDCPYEFSVLPADILGQVYEQFLGKVIRLTAGHQAKVEDKPEVRKAGGVYYTPTYIVDYIVSQTVGPLVEGKTSQDVAELRILDPACGSGSFLIAAYQYLLDWHLRFYSEHEPQHWLTRRNPPIYEVPSSSNARSFRLTIGERKRILLNNIFGVDIDPQAVEVTKLSLLLKVLEGESAQTVGRTLAMFHERALPDLADNIKCGNSLVGPDFFNNHQMNFWDDEERGRINAFDWRAEFAHVFRAGGFDAVIGNPPYVRQEGLGDPKDYYLRHYTVFTPTSDIYVNFIEKGLSLLKPSGLFGMIVSNKWVRSAYGRPLRQFLSTAVSIRQVVDLAGLPVFAGATVRTLILIAAPRSTEGGPFRYLAPVPLADFAQVRTGKDLERFFLERGVDFAIPGVSAEGWTFASGPAAELIARMRRCGQPLTMYVGGKPCLGIKTGLNEAFVIDGKTRRKLLARNPRCREIIRPVVTGRDVRRYSLTPADRYLIWTYVGVPIERYPAVMRHLRQHEKALKARWDKGDHWWELRSCDYYDMFEGPKIIYPDISTTCRFTLDREGFFGTNTTYIIPGDDLYLLGVLNSRLAQFYFSQVCAGLEGGGTTYLRFFGQYLEEFPVRATDLSDKNDKTRHDRMLVLVTRMLQLHKSLPSVRTSHEKTRIQRDIQATDRRIDQLVYELYGLTDEEIRIVEEATGEQASTTEGTENPEKEAKVE